MEDEEFLELVDEQHYIHIDELTYHCHLENKFDELFSFKNTK